MSWLAVFAMGVLLGLLGGGGGILTVPILVGFFGLAATQATGASLFIVGVASLLAAAEGFRQHEVDVREALMIAVPSAVGAFAARRFLVPSLPDPMFGIAKDNLLLGLFAGLMLVVGARMLRPTQESTSLNPTTGLIAVVGFAIGLVSGTLGAGGGFLIVPALTLMLGVDIRRAIPTSLTVIAIQSLIGFAGELGQPIPWDLLLRVLGVALLGVVLGIPLRSRTPKQQLRVGFAVLIFMVAGWMIFRLAV